MNKVYKLLSFIIVTFIFMFISTTDVKAVKVLLTASDSVEVNKTIDVTLSLTEYGNVTGKLELEYDKSVLTCTEGCWTGSKTVNGNTEIKMTFKGLKDADTVIKVTSNYQGADASKKIKVGAGTSTPASTTTTTTTTTVSKSNNANLKTLKLSDNKGKEITFSPTFSSSVYDYSANVDSQVDSVSIDVTMEDSKSNVIISNNASELIAGENNKITITVTAEDGTSKKVYNMNVNREALNSNALLSSLEIKEVPSFTLKEDKFNYTVKVKKSVKKLTLDYTVDSENTSVEITDNENLKNGSKVKILVTAEDGSKIEYTLNIKKEQTVKKDTTTKYSEEKNPIVIMVLSIIGFSLIGMIINVIRKK